MNDNKVKALCDHLEQEISWIETLNTLLTEEKEILATRQFEQLEEFSHKKQEISNSLEESARARISLINDVNTNLTPAEALKALLQDCTAEESTKVNTLNSKLASSLTLCRELNTINGQVIANNMYTRQEIVNALSGNPAGGAGTYTSHGNIQSANDPKHHREA